MAAQWRMKAACRGQDPEVFFPDQANTSDTKDVDRAKQFCASCRVTLDCLKFALLTNATEGVWGGLDEQERDDLQSF